MRETFGALGPIDHLVFSPVARAGGPARELDLAAARRAFEIKFWGPFAAVQAADVRESIVFVSGVAATTPMRGGSATAAVNGAIEALVRTLAVELAPVRVNAVSPGIIATPTWDVMAAEDRDAMFDRLAGALPAGAGRRGRRRRRGDLASAHERLRHRHHASGRRRPPARRPLTVRATRVADAEAFLARAGPFLAEHEPEHNLALGLLGRLRVEPRLYGFDPVFVVAEEAGAVVGCLLRTPPHGVVLSRFASLEAVDAVAEAVLDMQAGLPGAVGPTDVAARFAGTWSRLTGAAARLAIRQRVHAAADRARAPARARPHAGGEARTTCPTVLAWLTAFAEEALGEMAHVEEVEATYRRREADPDGAWLLWDDDGPVSLAAYGSPTPTGTRVGPVYTPPEHRGRGYATSLVAELTAERLATGLAFCFLFTDLAQPDLERDLRPDRLRAGGRLGSVVVRPAAGIGGPMPIQRRCRHGCTSRSASRSRRSPSAAGACCFPAPRAPRATSRTASRPSSPRPCAASFTGAPGEPRRPAQRDGLVRRCGRAAAAHARARGRVVVLPPARAGRRAAAPRRARRHAAARRLLSSLRRPPYDWRGCSSSVRTASAATATCRRTASSRGSARSSARSAPTAPRTRFGGRCPNCGGDFARRPIRPPAKLEQYPASTERVLKPHPGCSPAA